jgi:RNA polymerase sigma-70 factor (ECF subfamily)
VGRDHCSAANEEQAMVIDPVLISEPERRVPRHGGGDMASGGRADAWGALMAAAQSGHGGAYQRLLTEMSEWLARYFRRRLPAGEIDDAVQETLLAIHRRRHTYDPRLPLTPWLAGIAKRKWIDQLRGMGRRPTEELPSDLAVTGHEAAVTSASVLASLLDQLRPAQARVITLVKLQGFSVEDASRETGLSVSAVKMNVHRGLARLTLILEKTDDVD